MHMDYLPYFFELIKLTTLQMFFFLVCVCMCVCVCASESACCGFSFQYFILAFIENLQNK